MFADMGYSAIVRRVIGVRLTQYQAPVSVAEVGSYSVFKRKNLGMQLTTYDADNCMSIADDGATVYLSLSS